MPAEVETTGVLSAIRREVERGAVRARNGVKYFAGGEFAPEHPTPSEVIWRQGKAHVRHYRSESPRRFQQPVIAYLGLVGRSTIFDLYTGGSIVEMLMEWGYDTYVLDWGVPDELDAGNTLETYLKRHLPAALDAVCAESGCDDVTSFGYCMGGVLTVHALAAQPDLPIRNVVTLASPFDWSDLGSFVNAMRDGKLKLDELLDETGNVPGSIIRESFKRRKPTGDIVNYANLWQHLWDDRYVEGYQAINRFLSDHIPLAYGAAQQILDQWLADNAFVNDRLRFDGRRVSLADIDAPVLGVIAQRDDIASEESTSVLADILPNADVELLKIDTGHVSLFAGRQAVKVVMPRIFEWIEAHSEEVP
jgi:polyhydroxyalkanoate synthase subunit PhaC